VDFAEADAAADFEVKDGGSLLHSTSARMTRTVPPEGNVDFAEADAAADFEVKDGGSLLDSMSPTTRTVSFYERICKAADVEDKLIYKAAKDAFADVLELDDIAEAAVAEAAGENAPLDADGRTVQNWNAQSEDGKKIKEDILSQTGDNKDLFDFVGELNELADKAFTLAGGAKCHQTADWLVALFGGKRPKPAKTETSRAIAGSRKSSDALKEDLLLPAEDPRLYVVRYAIDDELYQAHSWVILRFQDEVMMVQSDMDKFSAGMWLRGNSDVSKMPGEDGGALRVAHKKYGQAQRIAVEKYNEALDEVFTSKTLKEFGLPAAEGRIMRYDVFDKFNENVNFAEFGETEVVLSKVKAAIAFSREHGTNGFSSNGFNTRRYGGRD